MKMHLHIMKSDKIASVGSDTILMLAGYTPGNKVYAYSQKTQTFSGRGCVAEVMTDIDKRVYNEIEYFTNKDFCMKDGSQYRYTFKHDNMLIAVLVDVYARLPEYPAVEVFDSNHPVDYPEE